MINIKIAMALNWFACFSRSPQKQIGGHSDTKHRHEYRETKTTIHPRKQRQCKGSNQDLTEPKLGDTKGDFKTPLGPFNMKKQFWRPILGKT